MSSHLMLVPSLVCPASCAYCFGPHAGGKIMDRETIEAVVEWQRALGGGANEADGNGRGPGPVEITFHGGEPLVPGARWYREALPLLRDGLAPRRVRFAAQSNLWLLTDELCELFREYGVSLGTSLDGPEAINDAQRGAGYFAKTMAGIERARAHGIDVGAICTFTTQSVAHAPEIFDFFVREGLNFSVHAALPSLRQPEADRWSITPEAHGELLVGLLDRYLEDLTGVRISTLDSMARSVSAWRGGICTFGECLGGYLAVGPDGAIYPCQRFAGMKEFAVGDVHVRPSLEELKASRRGANSGPARSTSRRPVAIAPISASAREAAPTTSSWVRAGRSPPPRATHIAPAIAKPSMPSPIGPWRRCSAPRTSMPWWSGPTLSAA
jgi:uncharacterized protein